MRISKVDLFKLPIDNSYTNVIDISDVGGLEKTKKRLYDTINLFYASDKKTFDGLSRSIKRVGNSTLLTLPISYEDGRDYNYMIINDVNGEYYFYFVTNIISENDSSDNPTSTFTLEWDVWNNNIEKFKDVNNTITKKHYDRVTFVTEDVIIPNSLVQFTNIDLPKISKNIPIGEQYIPTFFVFTFKELNNVTYTFFDSSSSVSENLKLTLAYFKDGITTVANKATFPTCICDSVGRVYNKNVVYVFAGIFDTKNNVYVNGSISSKPFIIEKDGDSYTLLTDASTAFNPKIITGNPKLTLPKQISPFINDITLSFNCPFDYTVNNDENGVNIDFTDNYLIPIAEQYNERTVQYAIGGDVIVDVGSSLNPRFYAPEIVKKRRYTVSIDELTGIKDRLNNKNNYLTPSNHFLIDPITYTPPFKSLFLTYNSEHLPLTKRIIGDTNLTIDVNLESSQPNFSVRNVNGLISSPTNKFIKNSGFLSFGVDSLENYLLKNSGQIETNKLNNNISAIVNLAKFGAGVYTSNPYLILSGGVGVVGDMTKMMGLEMSIADSQRMPDEWVTNNGESDIFYQDRLRLTMDYVDEINPAFIQFMNGVYSQGYSFPSFDSPFKNSRLTFDYVKTSGCDLSPLSINSNDREKLEEIFNRGVTKWHMWSKNGILQFDRYMIKDPNTVNNLEQITETNTQFNTWLYGN